VVGPLIGGAFAGADTILGIDGWRWVFLINVPIAIAAFIVVARVLNLPHTRRDHRIDWPGAVLLSVGLVPLLLVAEQGRDWGWGSGGSIACYLIGAVGLVLFVVDQRYYGEDALLPLRLFRMSVFSITSVANIIVGMGMFGGIVVIPLYLQIVKGATPTESGLLMLPMVLGIMTGSVSSGQLTSRTGRYKIFPLLGVPLMMGALILMHFLVDVDAPLWRTDIFLAMFGIGLGFCMQTLIVAVQNAVPPRDMGVSTGSATFFRSMGGTLGVAIFLSILFSTVGGKIADAFAAIAPTPDFQAALADPAVRANPANALVFQALQGGGSASADSGGVLQDSSVLQQLDPRLARPFLVGFADSMQLVFLVAACVLALAFVLLIFMKELPLRTMSAIQAQQSQGNGAGPTGAPGGRDLVAAVTLITLIRRIEQEPAASPTLVGAAARLVPAGNGHGTGDVERAQAAARTVLRPLATRLLMRVAGTPAAPPITAPASAAPTPALETTG
jgi:predicted MFS family arabinose efflux permease